MRLLPAGVRGGDPPAILIAGSQAPGLDVAGNSTLKESYY